jgi:hypothetical protein
MPSDADPDGSLTGALAAELARRTGVSWVRYDGHDHPVWHVWSDWSGGALCIVSGGSEQPLPELPDGALVEVVMRSGDTGGRLLTWTGRASVVRPEEDAWAPTTAALVAARLNLPDPATAADRWAADPDLVVRRITPAP